MVNTNTLTQVIPQLLAQGFLTLRQNAITPRLVNRGFDQVAGEKGSSIDVPLSSAIAVNDVTASYVAPDDAGVSPTKLNVPLDQWKEAAFFLTDKEVLESIAGVVPMQAGEAVKAIANKVDTDVLSLYKGIGGWAGVSGTTPFSVDLTEFLDARAVLNAQLAPPSGRWVILDTDADANALGTRAFQDVSYRGDTGGINEGQIGRKLGSDWFMNQNVPYHTAGTASGGNCTGTAGSTSLTINAAGTGTIVAGDVLVIGTDTYAAITGDTDISSGSTVITVFPALKTSPSGTSFSVKASHRVNLAAHRDAFILAVRPFSGADPLGLGLFQVIADPVSGLALRLEVTRQHKRTRFSYDVLYGFKVGRGEYGCRIAG